MWLIKKIDDEFDEVLIKSSCIKSFVENNVELFKQGWRLYARDVDVTESAEGLAYNDELTMMRPAGTGIETAYIIGAIVAVASAAVAILAAPKIPEIGGRDQQSATNSLGGRTNEFNNGKRIQDVRGRVNNFVPHLLQVPHYRFENNIESEHFALFTSANKIDIENVRDGGTDFNRLTKSKFNAWHGGGNPNNGTPPDFNIGGLIDRPLVNVALAKELQSAELQPPNDLTGAAVTWTLTGNGSVGTIGATSDDPLFNLTDYFEVDDILSMLGAFYFVTGANFFLWHLIGEATVRETFTSSTKTDLSTQPYKVLSVGANSMTVEISGAIGDTVYDTWQLMSGYALENQHYSVSSISKNFDTLYSGQDFEIFDLFADESLTDPVTSNLISLNPSISQTLSGAIGPITVDKKYDSISINVVAESGFYKLVKNNEAAITAAFSIYIEETLENGDITGLSKLYNFELSSSPVNISAQAAITVDQQMNDYEYQRVSFRRLSNRDKSDGVSNVDKAILRDLYFIEELSGVQDYGDVGVAQVVIESSPAAREVKQRQVNFDAIQLGAPYIGNGQFGAEQRIENIADVVTSLALDKRNGRLTLNDIDADLFLDVQQQLIDYYGNADFVKVGYALDSTKMRFQEMFSLFWNTVRCAAYSQGAVYRVYPNIARSDSSKQFTHRNKIIGTDTRERVYDKPHDGIELTYRSNETGSFETVTKHVNGIESFNRLKVDLSGATQSIQAETRASFELNKLKYQKYNVAFEADGISRLTVPGERVDSVDQTRIVKRPDNLNTYTIYDGQVQEISGLVATLSQPVYFTSGETHTIRFTNSKGELLEAIGCTRGATDYSVILESAPSQSVYTGYKMEKTSFTFAPDLERKGMAVLILGTKAKKAKGLRTRQLTGVNYDSRYFENDVV